MQHKYSRLFSRSGNHMTVLLSTNDFAVVLLKFKCGILFLYLAVSHGAPLFSCTFVACDRYLFWWQKKSLRFLKEETVISGFLCKGLKMLYCIWLEACFLCFWAVRGTLYWPWLRCVCHYCSKYLWIGAGKQDFVCRYVWHSYLHTQTAKTTETEFWYSVN